jgi:hypothetical protein
MTGDVIKNGSGLYFDITAVIRAGKASNLKRMLILIRTF